MNQNFKKMKDRTKLSRRDSWNAWPHFEDFFRNPWTYADWGLSRPVEPSYHISETEDAYELDIVMPGVNKEDIVLKAQDNTLSVSYEVEKTEENEDAEGSSKQYLRSSYQKSFHLSENMDSEKIEARHGNGILEIRIPKRKPSTPTIKEIPVR